MILGMTLSRSLPACIKPHNYRKSFFGTFFLIWKKIQNFGASNDIYNQESLVKGYTIKIKISTTLKFNGLRLWDGSY